IFLVPSHEPQRGMPCRERLGRVDWIGTVLLSGTIVPLVVAVTLGGNKFPWNSVQIIGLFVLFGFNPSKPPNDSRFSYLLHIQPNPLHAFSDERTKTLSGGNAFHADNRSVAYLGYYRRRFSS